MADENETVHEIFYTDEKSSNELFVTIGHFIFQFSQLETIIRYLLSELLSLKGDRNFNLIVSPYDFRTLCDVTSGYLCNLPDATGEFQAKVKKTFNACKLINDDRVRVAHGAWTIEGGAKHVSRQSFDAKQYFLKPDDLRAKTKQTEALVSEIMMIIIGEKDEWPSVLPSA